MKVIEADDTTQSMMCPYCDLVHFQTDNCKFFLFCCQGCGNEVQLDYEFSWETCKINNQSILPDVKHQRGSTCDPHAIVTAVEGGIRFYYAKEKKAFQKCLSVDDLISQYEKRMGPGFSWDSNEKEPRTKNLKELMERNGVMSDKEFKSGKKTGIRYKAKSHMAPSSFEASCKKILKGSLLHTSIHICNNFDSLGGDEIYIADYSRPKRDLHGTEVYHAIVLVGFGVKDKMQFFRFMNSHGTRFGKKGFGSIHTQEISSVSSFKPLMQ